MISIIAEIGINHGGDLQKALRLIQLAASSGADAVKFQYRPESGFNPSNITLTTPALPVKSPLFSPTDKSL